MEDKKIARIKAKYFYNKIFKKYGYKCNNCEQSQIDKLQVHHLDYDVDKSPLDNCILLCDECHTLKHYPNSKNSIKLKALSKN